MATLKRASFPNCCGMNIIYGFGGSSYDGTRRESTLSLEEVKEDLDYHERNSWSVATLMVTLNSDQYPIYHTTLKECGYKLIHVNESVGHPTAIFTYTKRINKTSLEGTKNRLTSVGLDVKLPVHTTLKQN